MELKVRADGILRVVCGVTENTTCQEVVKALAYAMGRTGRFTLIEKWRDNERPLLPSEFPLQILQKWGEYANEVQLILQQSDKQQTFKPEVVREPLKSKDKFVLNYNPPPPKEEIRRSLTFSGAHNSVVPSSKRKTPLQALHESSSVDNPRQVNIPYQPSYNYSNHNHIPDGNELHPPQEPSVKLKTGYASHNQISRPTTAPSPAQVLHQRTPSGNEPVHYRQNSYPHQHSRTHQYSQNHQHSQNQHHGQIHPHNQKLNHQQTQHPHSQPHHRPNVMNHSAQNHQEKVHSKIPGHSRVAPPGLSSAKQPQQSAQQRLEQSKPKGVSRENVTGVVPPDKVLYGDLTVQNKNIKTVHSQHNSKSTSILPVVQNKSRSSAFQPVVPNKHKQINYDHSKQNGDIDIPVYTSVSAVQTNDLVEEYDLDSNFPDIVRDSKKELLIEEYHVPGDEDISKPYKQEDPETMKMQRLITIQQERIKMQESQLELIDTELTSLEEKDEDRTNQLQTIGDEMNKLQQKQEEYEVEITDLEKVMWVDQIEAEKQKEKQFRSEISELKVQISTCDNKISKLNDKVVTLNDELEKEQKEIDIEKEKIKQENEKIEKELENVKGELESKLKLFEMDKETFDKLEEELKQADEEKNKQQEEIESMEKELKNVNMEMFNKPPLSPSGENSDSGEAVLKMLEGRISPGIGIKSPRIGLSRKIIQSPLSQVLSTSKNPNGVWV